MQAQAISRGWIALTGILVVLEVLFVYEAVAADVGGYQRIFATFVGLSVVCFAGLLYAVSMVFYPPEPLGVDAS